MSQTDKTPFASMTFSQWPLVRLPYFFLGMYIAQLLLIELNLRGDTAFRVPYPFQDDGERGVSSSSSSSSSPSRSASGGKNDVEGEYVWMPPANTGLVCFLRSVSDQTWGHITDASALVLAFLVFAPPHYDSDQRDLAQVFGFNATGTLNVTRHLELRER